MTQRLFKMNTINLANVIIIFGFMAASTFGKLKVFYPLQKKKKNENKIPCLELEMNDHLAVNSFMTLIYKKKNLKNAADCIV